MTGHPFTADDPEHITFERIILLSLIQRAYFSPAAWVSHTLDFDQIIGPSWLGTEFYSIDAKVPPGTAKEQLILMWQGLLTERFHLKVHFATKEFTVYELTVGKNGPKFKKSGEEPQTQQPGFPAPPPGAKLPYRSPCREIFARPFEGRRWGSRRSTPVAPE